MAFTTHDNAPYLYRRSGGGGDKEIDKLVGGTIAWNQMVENVAGAFTQNRGTKTFDEATRTYIVSYETATETPTGVYSSGAYLKVQSNHCYFMRAKIKSEGATSVYMGIGGATKNFTGLDLSTKQEMAVVLKTTSANAATIYPRTKNDVEISDIQIHDLTLMFGSTIAGYVYSLEQSSEGSGLAWLRSYGFFTEDYYDYNSGELKSVSNLVSHDMTGEDASTTLHSYPLGDVTLRGLPKLNGNTLYYDGDTYESNGTVTRKYRIVDMGTLKWYASVRAGITRFHAVTPGIKQVSKGNEKANILCSGYETKVPNQTYVGETGISVQQNTDQVYIYDPQKESLSDADFKTAMSGVYLVYELASSTTETADAYTNPQWVDPNGTERYTLSANAFPMPVGHETTYNTDMGSKTVNTQVNLSMTEPFVRQVYAKEGDTARVLNIHLDQTEEDGTLRILRPDGTEVTADAVLVPEFYDGLMAEIPSDATSVVGKCYCDVEQNGVSSMPFTLNVKKNERAT